MTLREFGETIEYNIEHGIRHAILGLGAPGVGKSQIIRQIGDKYGYTVIDIRLAQMSEVEIGGLIYPNESRTKTIWLSPEILPDEERDGKKTILLLDEITSCSKRVQVAAYQLILDRRIGQYHLPEGTFVIALGNREDDDGVYIRLADPLADRFEIHYIEADFESWKYDYALKNDVHSAVISFLTFKPSALHNQQADVDNMRFSTPRSWVRVSDIMKFDDDVDNPVIRHKIIGNVGETVGREFIEYCRKHREMVTADDFLDGRKKAPASPEQAALLVEAIVGKASFLEGKEKESELTQNEREELNRIISGLFRMPKAENTTIGLVKLLGLNRLIVKSVLSKRDDNNIIEFVRKNKYALGLSDADTAGMISPKARANWLSMWKDGKK